MKRKQNNRSRRVVREEASQLETDRINPEAQLAGRGLLVGNGCKCEEFAGFNLRTITGNADMFMCSC